MKGLELPVNILILLVIAIIVLIAISVLFYGTYSGSSNGFGLAKAKNTACTMVISIGCDKAKSEEIMVNFDANKDGKIDSADTLSELCINFYMIGTEGHPDDQTCKSQICNCKITA
jgi:hypothetical protein